MSFVKDGKFMVGRTPYMLTLNPLINQIVVRDRIGVVRLICVPEGFEKLTHAQLQEKIRDAFAA